jgi:hypothetical protein
LAYFTPPRSGSRKPNDSGSGSETLATGTGTYLLPETSIDFSQGVKGQMYSLGWVDMGTVTRVPLNVVYLTKSMENLKKFV